MSAVMTSTSVNGVTHALKSRTLGVSKPTVSTTAVSQRKQMRSVVVHAADSGETRNSESGIFMRQITEAEKDAEIKYLSGMIKLWLDDEWSVQTPHSDLAKQAAEKCVAMRLAGCEEMGSLVMGIAQDLLSFDFSDTFVNSFEVANKTSEILMMKEGYEVCCLSKEDETRQQRYEEMVANGEM